MTSIGSRSIRRALCAAGGVGLGVMGVRVAYAVHVVGGGRYRPLPPVDVQWAHEPQSVDALEATRRRAG